jgi:hypothetical protein
MFTMRRHRADEPHRDPRVAAVLAAAGAPTEPGTVPGEAAALAAFRAAVPVTTRRTRMLPSLKTAAVAAAATGALLTGGVAAAATGTLPGAAQDTAQSMLGTVGVTVPGTAAAAGTHPDTRGRSAEATAAPVTGETAAPTATATPGAATGSKGAAVSELATTTDLTGRAKGAAISALASEGRSKAGAPHPTPTTTTTTTSTEPSAHGQGTAATASSGRSTAGSSHRP